MSAQARTTSLIVPAIIAGILGGIIIDAFLSLVLRTSPIGLWTFVAATVAGPGSPWILGFVVHFVTSIVWAVLYLYVFGAIGQLRNWIVGAIVWGVVVDAIMQVLVATKTGGSWWNGFSQGLLGHIVFYAAPVAYYIARATRRA